MKILNGNKIKERLMKLFGVKKGHNKDYQLFVEWTECQSTDFNQTQIFLKLENSGILKSEIFSESEDPEYDLAWAITYLCGEDNLLKDWENFKKEMGEKGK